MDDMHVVALTVPADVGLSSSFVDRLEDMMAGALGRSWRLQERHRLE